MCLKSNSPLLSPSYLAMNQVHEASRVVARRNDQASLKTACHMNLIVQEQEQALAYAHRALSQFLLAAQWKEAHVFLKEHDGLKVESNATPVL